MNKGIVSPPLVLKYNLNETTAVKISLGDLHKLMYMADWGWSGDEDQYCEFVIKMDKNRRELVLMTKAYYEEN